MDVSRETMTVEKYPKAMNRHDIVCLGEKEILILDIDHDECIITYHDGRQPVRVMLKPWLTYETITEGERMTEPTMYEVCIDMKLKTTVEVKAGESVDDAMSLAVRLMPSHAIDALERHGYRIKRIVTDATRFERVDAD
jgi:hypothetical protein